MFAWVTGWFYGISNDELISNNRLWALTHGCVSIGQPARTYPHQLRTDTGCNLEDLPGAIDDKVGWRESQRNPSKRRD